VPFWKKLFMTWKGTGETTLLIDTTLLIANIRVQSEWAIQKG
jgi:hypothetical protein